MTKGWQSIAAETTDYSKKSFEKSRVLAEKLIAVKKFDEALQLQSDFAKSAYEDFLAEATKIGELYTLDRQGSVQADRVCDQGLYRGRVMFVRNADRSRRERTASPGGAAPAGSRRLSLSQSAGEADLSERPAEPIRRGFWRCPVELVLRLCAGRRSLFGTIGGAEVNVVIEQVRASVGESEADASRFRRRCNSNQTRLAWTPTLAMRAALSPQYGVRRPATSRLLSEAWRGIAEKRTPVIRIARDARLLGTRSRFAVSGADPDAA